MSTSARCLFRPKLGGGEAIQGLLNSASISVLKLRVAFNREFE